VLLILNDVQDGAEQEFNRWYQQQHLPERLAVPGFRRARRYRAVGGQPANMAVYDCHSVEVLSSPEYRERLANPTEWTRKVLPNFRNMLRSACRESWSCGTGTGGNAIVVHCKPIQGREADARRFIQCKLGPLLMQTASTVRIALWEVDREASGDPAAEMALRAAPDGAAQWVLFIESLDLAHTALALHAHILSCGSVETGLLIGTWTRYQLVFERSTPL
jgi:hypothetical protein